MRGRINPKIWLVMSVFIVALASTSFAEQIIYVDADSNGLNNGTSWTNAYKYLQDTLADAKSSVKPVEIRVAQGIYKPDEDTLHPEGTGNREATFQLINGVTLKGGYAGFGESDPNARDIALYETILSGDIGKPSDKSDNCYHVFYHPKGLNLDTTAILDGFTITGGNANGKTSPYFNGGGMCNWYNSPLVEGCTFSTNSATYGGGVCNWYSSPLVNNCVFTTNSGGGMCNDYHSSPTLKGCIFVGNFGGGISNTNYSMPMMKACTFSGNSGGGMYNGFASPTVEDCSFSDNSAADGSGMYNNNSSPAVRGCTFSTNSATSNGGGMYNKESDPALESCTFSGNSAQYGGGMYNMFPFYNRFRGPTVECCTFSANSATEGGGMYNYQSSPAVKVCTFTANSATFGGGMYNYSSSPAVKVCSFRSNSATGGSGMFNEESGPTVTNCTFTANSAGYGGGMCNHGSSPTVKGCTFSGNSTNWISAGMYNYEYSSPTVTNCILWADTLLEINVYSYGCTPIVTYSDVQGGWSGTGNINADPLFVDANNGDYHLLPDSPCINAGNPNYVAGPNETDIDGESRVMLGRVDMGADEFNPFEIDFVVINKRRISRTVFEYECKASLHNISHFDVKNIQLELIKTPENMRIIDPNVTFGNIEVRAGESATSIDTCTFEVNRAKAIEPAEIIWWSRCDLVVTGQTMQHTGLSVIFLEQITITGDLTGEGKIDLEDLAKLAGRWLWVGPPSGIPEDITGDGIINLADFAELAGKWRGGE